MDATFKIVPVGEFSQLLIFYFRIKHEVCLCIIYHLDFSFSLGYKSFFIGISIRIRLDESKLSACLRGCVAIDIQQYFCVGHGPVTSDYELAMRNAIKKLFPAATMYACYFHYTQAVKRRASQLREAMLEIQNDDLAKFIYQRCQCLPLLPAK